MRSILGRRSTLTALPLGASAPALPPTAQSAPLQYIAVDIAEFRTKTLTQLQDMAEELGVEDWQSLSRQRLTNRIQRTLLANEIELTAHGVLELVKDGYGFLRAQEWSYLPSPDDVYVGKGLVRELDLRTGDSIVGAVRPPRRGERYMSVTRITSLNEREPDPESPRSKFDNLRPIYPDERLRVEEDKPSLSMRVVDLVAPIE